MSFLQPWMLAALPLAAIPIIIHLINQRRYQTTQWAAMMFLLTANRMSRGYAKIRQWAILALRTLVIAALVLMVGRPLASGSLGGGLIGSITGRDSANTIVLLDRSPSMQQRDGSGTLSKLESSVSQLAGTLQTLGTGRLTLIESNGARPREIDSPASLLELPEAGPSDASADLPALMLSALDYIKSNELGRTDVWICSDLRAHDWRSKDGRWVSLREAFANLGRRVRFRLLAFPKVEPSNLSVRVDEVRFDNRQAEAFVSLSVKIEGGGEGEAKPTQLIPVTVELDGASSTLDVPLNGIDGQTKGHRIAVPKGQTEGWGRVSVPADAMLSDNDFFFTYNQTPVRRTVIVTDDPDVGRVLQLASETGSEEDVQYAAEVVSPNAVASIAWEEVALVLWHAPLKKSKEPSQADDAKNLDDQQRLQAFVDRGGSVIFFPPEVIDNTPGEQAMFGMSWGSWNEPKDPISVASWRGETDLLANTMAGDALPVGSLKIHRFANVNGEATSLATLIDGTRLLIRAPTPQGSVYVCATTPLAKDSSLAIDGVVLYVMIQRAIQEGARSLYETKQLDAGETNAENAKNWKPLVSRSDRFSNEGAFNAGVYSDERRLLAVNRSVAEDQRTTVSTAQIDQLFRGLILDRVNEQSGSTQSLVDEVWRSFLIIMLIAMIGEAYLCLPRKITETFAQNREGVPA